MNGEKLTMAFKRIRARLRLSDDDDGSSADALQEAFCRLWTRRERIRDEGEADRLLAVAARNIRIDRYRQDSLHTKVCIDDAGDIANAECGADDVEDAYSRVDRLVRATLSSRDCDILYKRERDGWDFEDIAAAYGISEANVRMIVSRARKTIRELYRQQNRNL